MSLKLSDFLKPRSAKDLSRAIDRLRAASEDLERAKRVYRNAVEEMWFCGETACSVNIGAMSFEQRVALDANFHEGKGIYPSRVYDSRPTRRAAQIAWDRFISVLGLVPHKFFYGNAGWTAEFLWSPAGRNLSIFVIERGGLFYIAGLNDPLDVSPVVE